MSANGRVPHQMMPIVILGAGSSGLGTALGLVRNGYSSAITVVEKNDRPGGLAGSFAWKDHLLDYGPHRLSPNLPVIRSLAEGLLGTDCLIKKNQHGVQFDGKLYQFPIRIADWMSPRSVALLGLFGSSFLWGKVTWITRRFETDTFQSAIERKFGHRFYQHIAKPMTEKVWSRASEIDPAFVQQRFASVRPREILKKMIVPQQELHPSLFYYPRKGFQQLWDVLAEYLEQRETAFCYQSKPRVIEVVKDRVVQLVMETPAGERVIDGPELGVVSTLPVVSLVQVLEGFDKTFLQRCVQKLKVRSMILVALEFRCSRTLPYRVIQFPETRFCFNRLTEQNEFSRDMIEAGKSVVLADITVDKGSETLERSDEELIDGVKKDLKRLRYVNVNDVTDACVKRVPFAYLVPDLETRKAMFEIHRVLSRIRNLHLLGRFSSGEYNNSDYAIDSGMTLANLLSGKISEVDYLTLMDQKHRRPIVG